MKISRKWAALGGFAIGAVNGLLGAGGGMLAVPLLAAMGVSPKGSHATSLSVIVPLSAVSALAYILAGQVQPAAVLPYLPGGLLGALAGGWLMPRLPAGWIKLGFSGLLLWGGIRLVLP